MSISFTGAELINIAIGIEKQGTAYYDVMARSTSHKIAKDLFFHLAAVEKDHAVTFQNMLVDIETVEIPEKQLQEYNDYFQALISSAVFTDEMAASELATHLDSEIEGVDIAISAEKDSILFYYNLKETLPNEAVKLVDKIIIEEKSHLSLLTDLKKKLLAIK